jgi:predicted dehydrogenase
MSFRYFVIGSGAIGKRHANNLKSLGANVTLYSWRGVNIDKLIADIKSCNKKAGVIIATSTDIRLPLIELCANAGAALYIEKPIAYKLSDVARIYSLPKETLERSVVGFMMRYHPMFLYLIENKINNIFRASFEIGYDVNKWRQNWSFSNSYASKPEGGGVLLDLCHEIDIAQLLCGSGSICNVSSIQHPEYKEVDIATSLIFLSEQGINYRVSMDYLSPVLIRRGNIVGLDKEISYDFSNNKIITVDKLQKHEEVIEYDRNQMFIDLMSDFITLTEFGKTKNPYIPRLDKVKDVCNVIATAWEKREFTGELRMKIT